MALESGTYINSLNSANPVATDGLAQADDHLRLLKATILASFPGITGAMTATHTVLNGLDARVTTLESSLPAPQGTKLLFQQAAAPTGWTKDTTHNDKTIRVVTGTVSSGGTNAFSSAFSYTPAGSVNTSVTGTVANHALTTSEIPAHTHSLGTRARVQVGNDNGVQYGGGGASTYNGVVIDTENTGGGGAHNHGWSGSASSAFTGTATDFAPQYVDTIIASKD